MFRLALIALASTVLLLIALALVPQTPRATPGGTIHLTGARVTLYPQADSEAVWHFGAARVAYEPTTQETVLHMVREAERAVGGETDFTLTSDRVTIDPQENLRGQQIEVYLPDVRWTLDMRGRDGDSVVLDQQQGRFFAPLYEITDEADVPVSRSGNLSMNFDLTDMQSGGEGTQSTDTFQDRAE